MTSKQSNTYEKMIAINASTCIKCSRCIKVCPANIFKFSDKRESIELENEHNCIACGHCVAACPTFSITHTEFPPVKIHSIDKEFLPTPEQIMLLCKTRRSNRAFSSQPIPEKHLNMILEAAHRAPTASNLQQVKFTLITNPDVLEQIANHTIEIFSSMVKRMKNPLLKPIIKKFMPAIYKLLPRFQKMEQNHIQGNDPILRKATALVFIHTPEKSRFGCEDANLAYQNGSLMAESLGVSQFYTGFICTAIKQDKANRIAQLVGIDEKIHAGMALGMPEFHFPNYIDKKDIEIKKIV